MSSDDKYDKKKRLNITGPETEGGESGESGQGGKNGAIEFRDFTASAESIRDDLLSFEDKRRLISTHKDTSKLRIKSQKDKRDEYKKLKEGKVTLQAFREGRGVGTNAFKANPRLTGEAQFSGSVDKKVNGLPSEYDAETNQEKLEEALQNKLRLGHSPQPKFNPKPHGPGYGG